MNGGPHVPSSAPPRRTPKQPNAVLRLFDSPLLRDWAFWLTIGWAALGATAIGTSKDHNGSPAWLDTLLATLTFAALFGLVPAWIRLIVRRIRQRRSQRHSVASAKAVAAWPSRDLLPGPAPNQPSPRPDSQTGPEPVPKRERVRERQTFAAFDDRRTSLQNRTTSRTSVALEKDRYQETTSVLSDARSGLPHPLARAVRTFQLANTSRGQYEALLDAAEILAIVMSTTAATLLPVVAHPVEAGNATFGTWTTWLGRLMDPSPARTSPVPGLQEALNGTPGNPGIVACLNTLRQERNRSAHGDKPNSREEAAMRVRESAPHLEAALDKAGFLQNLQWLLIDSFDYEERSHEFNVVARVAMGDHPDFASRPYTWHVPVSRHDVYVLSPQGPVPMSDLVASRYCPQCHQPEMCFASKVDKKHGTIHWKSFARGHGVGESGLRSEMPTQNAS